MSDPSVLLEIRNAVGIVTLNRPDRLNALTLEMEERYVDTLARLDEDPLVHAIVVTGAGRGFCAGLDIEVLATIGSSEALDDSGTQNRISPAAVRKPLIGAINGPAAGMGFVHALYCDVRFASSSASFMTAFVKRGLVAEFGSTWLLPRIVGVSAALDLIMSSRKVEAEEAHRLGLVNFLVPEGTSVLEAAVSYAEQIATWCAPVEVAASKRMVLDHHSLTFSEAVADALIQTKRALDSSDPAEGVASYLDRRPPDFRPLGARG